MRRWFAWYPVWTDDCYIVWLSRVWCSTYVTELGNVNTYYVIIPQEMI